MEKIKFRAIQSGTNTMIYGIPYRVYKSNYIDSIVTDEGEVEYIRVDTLTQLSGKKDIKGKEIYAGDIVRQKLPDEDEENGYFYWYGIVEQVSGCWLVSQIGHDYRNTAICDRELLFDDDEIYGAYEVIGNIYQNPELIKKREK